MTSLLKLTLGFLAVALGVLGWYRMTELPRVFGIVLALGFGGAAVAGVRAWTAHRRKSPADWSQTLLGVVLAMLVTVVSLASDAVIGPSAAGVPLWVGILLFPGVWAMNVFGRHAFDPAAFYGGFALNIIIWGAVMSFVLRRLRRERA